MDEVNAATKVALRIRGVGGGYYSDKASFYVGALILVQGPATISPPHVCCLERHPTPTFVNTGAQFGID
jgi:hypothetical protein